MVEKIYDKVGSVQEINGIAADLRRIGLIEEIKILAEKNNIPTDDVKDYLKGNDIFWWTEEMQKPTKPSGVSCWMRWDF